MKIRIKQAIIIGATAAALGGLLAQGALANPAPRPVPVVQTQTVAPATNTQTAQSYVNGMVGYMQGWVNQAAAKGQVTPQEQQVFTQMYGYMNQYAGVMYNMMGGGQGYAGIMGGTYNR